MIRNRRYTSRSGALKKGGKRDNYVVPINSLAYTGSFHPKIARDNKTVTTLVKAWASSIAFVASASFSAVIDNGGNLTNIADWANLKASFSEYRVESMEVVYLPRVPANTVLATTPSQGVVCTDRDDNVALTGIGDGLNHESALPIAVLWQKHRIGIKRVGTDESDFSSTASPVATFWIKYFVTDIAAVSLTYGDFYVTYVISFRGGD